jgi:hypothetical protein
MPNSAPLGAWCVEFRAAFAIGGANSDGCRQNYSRIETEAACQSLANIAGASLATIAGADLYAGSDEYSYYPVGCFRHTISGKFYWNTDKDGANNSFAQPLCAGAPHAAPPPYSGYSVRSTTLYGSQ